MKKLIIALAAFMASVAAYGQGQFVFNNRIGTEVQARFILPTDPATGTSSSVGSPDWTVQLFGGTQGTPAAQLVPLNPASTGFRGAAGTAAAGFVTGITPEVPGVAPGGAASILVRVLGPGGIQADFGPYNVTLGGGTITPPNLALGTTPLVVPEPTTLALGALGVGALLLMRRRK